VSRFRESWRWKVEKKRKLDLTFFDHTKFARCVFRHLADSIGINQLRSFKSTPETPRVEGDLKDSCEGAFR